MILNLDKFVAEERPHWSELDQLLQKLDQVSSGKLSLDEARRLHRLHHRAASDLARLSTFSGEPGLVRELENLVARSHAEVHASVRSSGSSTGWIPGLVLGFPRAFRRHLGLFAIACCLMSLGALFGGVALVVDPQAKQVLIPFPHLMGDPADRVAAEEADAPDDSGGEVAFAGMLMEHNIRVSLLAMSLGTTAGVGTGTLLFYNGAILGAVGLDYIRAGETLFLMGWLLPHGSIEIPAILIAGQAGLLLGVTLIGGRRRQRLAERLQQAAPDMASLIIGVAALLVWAGIVEAFLSQNHEPEVPYVAKIAFGLVSLTALAGYLALAGRKSPIQP